VLATDRHLSVAQHAGNAVRGWLSDAADTARLKFVAQLSLCQGEPMPSVTPKPDKPIELGPTPNVDLGAGPAIGGRTPCLFKKVRLGQRLWRIRVRRTRRR